MKLLPIDIDKNQNKRFVDDPECIPILNIFTENYEKVGFNKPWIAYFITNDKNEIVGGGGFKR